MPRLGWLPDAPDGRDKSATLWLAPGTTYPSVDRRDLVVEVLDQGPTSSCVAHAEAQQIRCQLIRQGIIDAPLPSRRMLYSAARREHGDQYLDAGTYLRSGFRAMRALGFCPESVHPWDPRWINEGIPADAIRAAADQRWLDGYYRIPTVGTSRSNYIRAALSKGHTVSFGTLVDAAFFDHTGLEPWTRDGGIEGGHAMLVVGYDSRGVTIVNSWGTGWGRDGFGLISWEQMERDETNDLWIAELVPELSVGAA